LQHLATRAPPLKMSEAANRGSDVQFRLSQGCRGSGDFLQCERPPEVHSAIMADWKSALNADPTDWLLEPSNPSVRYFTLTEILELPAAHP